MEIEFAHPTRLSRLDEMREYVEHVMERLITFAELQERLAESGTW